MMKSQLVLVRWRTIQRNLIFVVIVVIWVLLCTTNLSDFSANSAHAALLPPKDDDEVAVDDCAIITNDMVNWIELGDLSRARSLALKGYTQSPHCKEEIIKEYKLATERILSSASLFELLGSFNKKEKTSSFITTKTDGGVTTNMNHSNYDRYPSHRLTAKQDTSDCLPDVLGTMGDPFQEWDSCCSILPQNNGDNKPEDEFSFTFREESSSFGQQQQQDDKSKCHHNNPCCEFFPNSKAHLRLPALHEPAVRVRIQVTHSTTLVATAKKNQRQRALDLEQDGYLRPFEVSTILWPSGYLLSQCLSNPVLCEIEPLIHQAIIHHDTGKRLLNLPIGLELGTGIGAASISFALYLQDYFWNHRRQQHAEEVPLIVSTDVSPHSLALTASNAYWNMDSAKSILIHQMNYTNLTSVVKTQEQYFPATKGGGASVIFGSSLQKLFHDTYKSDCILWDVLDVTMASSNYNPESVAIFVHTKTERLLPPEDGRYVVVKRVGGENFAMNTRMGGDDSSDFEASVFKKRKVSDQQKVQPKDEL